MKTSNWGTLTRIGGEEVTHSPPTVSLAEDTVHFGRVSSLPEGSGEFTHRRQFAISAAFVSSVHFSLSIARDKDEKEKTRYWLTDFSRNGTFLNGELVGAKNVREVRAGDEISLRYKGKVCIVYQFVPVVAAVESVATSSTATAAIAGNDPSTAVASAAAPAEPSPATAAAATTKNALADSLAAQIAVIQDEARATEQRLLTQLSLTETLTKDLEKCQRRLKSEEKANEDAAEREKELREQVQAMQANRIALEARTQILENTQEELLSQVRDLKHKLSLSQDAVRERERQVTARESLLQESTRALQEEQSVRVERERELAESELRGKNLCEEVAGLQENIRKLQKEVNRMKKRNAEQSDFVAQLQSHSSTQAKQAAETASLFSLLLQNMRGLEHALHTQQGIDNKIHSMLSPKPQKQQAIASTVPAATATERETERENEKEMDIECFSSPFSSPRQRESQMLALSLSPCALPALLCTQTAETERATTEEATTTHTRTRTKRALSHTDDDEGEGEGEGNTLKRRKRSRESVCVLGTLDENHAEDEEREDEEDEDIERKGGRGGVVAALCVSADVSAVRGAPEDEMDGEEHDLHDLVFESTQVPFSAVDTLEDTEKTKRETDRETEAARENERDDTEQRESEKERRRLAEDEDEEQTALALERRASKIDQLQPPFPADPATHVSMQNVDLSLVSQDSAMRQRSSGTHDDESGETRASERLLSSEDDKSDDDDDEQSIVLTGPEKKRSDQGKGRDKRDKKQRAHGAERGMSPAPRLRPSLLLVDEMYTQVPAPLGEDDEEKEKDNKDEDEITKDDGIVCVAENEQREQEKEAKHGERPGAEREEDEEQPLALDNLHSEE